jgi:hypothetical protein
MMARLTKKQAIVRLVTISSDFDTMAKQFVLDNDLESDNLEHYSKLDKAEFE